MNQSNASLSVAATILLTAFLFLGLMHLTASQLTTANEIQAVYVSIHGGQDRLAAPKLIGVKLVSGVE